MTAKRKIEIFSAGCPACNEVVDLVNQIMCSSCEVTVLNMNDSQVAKPAKRLGIGSVPTVVIDGKIADCCNGRAMNEESLRAAGVGQRI